MEKCLSCDQEKRLIAKGLCNACYCKRRYWKDPEKSINYSKEYYKRHKEERAIYQRKHNTENIDNIVDYRRTPEFRAKSRERYRTRKQHYHKAQALYRNKPEYKFSAGRSCAKRRDLEWSIDLETFKNLISNPCHYCGSNLSSNIGCCLDRKDNGQGYTIQNVLPCCGDCNKIRLDKLTVDEMKTAMEAVLLYRKAQTESAYNFV